MELEGKKMYNTQNTQQPPAPQPLSVTGVLSEKSEKISQNGKVYFKVTVGEVSVNCFDANALHAAGVNIGEQAVLYYKYNGQYKNFVGIQKASQNTQNTQPQTPQQVMSQPTVPVQQPPQQSPIDSWAEKKKADEEKWAEIANRKAKESEQMTYLAKVKAKGIALEVALEVQMQEIKDGRIKQMSKLGLYTLAQEFYDALLSDKPFPRSDSDSEAFSGVKRDE